MKAFIDKHQHKFSTLNVDVCCSAFILCFFNAAIFFYNVIPFDSCPQYVRGQPPRLKLMDASRTVVDELKFVAF